jgi:hypothetical protein
MQNQSPLIFLMNTYQKQGTPITAGAAGAMAIIGGQGRFAKAQLAINLARWVGFKIKIQSTTVQGLPSLIITILL